MDTHPTNTSIFAELMGLDNKTLHHWYKEHLSNYEPEGRLQIHAHDVKVNKTTTVEVPIVCPENVGEDMAIDEKMIGEEFYTLFTNRQTGKIALCAASTQSSHLQQAFTPILSKLPIIKTITRDMAGCFSKLCTAVIPQGIQIADKFHVISNSLDAMQAVRIRHRQKIMEQQRNEFQQFKEEEKKRKLECEKEGTIFKSRKFKYEEEKLSNGDTLSEIIVRSHFLLYKFESQWTVKQKRRAMALFEKFPEIKCAYELTCQFRIWYAKENIGKHKIQLEKQLFKWYEAVEDAQIDEISNFKSTIERNEETVIAYFENGHTNAIAENLNGRIKKFISSNQGVRNRDYFFFRLKHFYA